MEPYHAENYHNYAAYDASGSLIAVIAVTKPIDMRIYGEAVRETAMSAMKNSTEGVDLQPISPTEALHLQSLAAPLIFTSVQEN